MIAEPTFIASAWRLSIAGLPLAREKMLEAASSHRVPDMQPTAEQDLIEARELLKKQLLVENAGWPWIAAEIAEMATAVGVLQLPPQTTQHPASCGTALASSRGN